MSVELYAHNQIAYRAVCAMLAESGRAAVIHPTGTGKSYIAFHLIEEKEGQRFLWLSPSEYIFRSQMDSLLVQAPDFPVERVTFLTYARLMLLKKEELEELRPDYIILDEFHRCGAHAWGKGIEALLELYPNARVLGLSATSVRYLDNQRDMAEELFDRNVASEMTLGEAIVRGILPAPTYVSAIYGYDEELKNYQSRIRSLRGRGTQEQNQKYLDALRRKLSKAEGLDSIFRKYMTERNGKYILFCAGVEHMQEMQEKAAEWFGGIDPDFHMYSVYADSPEASEEFERFKTDGSEHLKLLYCIDMLNEGVHVKGISGVILFRPTVSPIIYKQQIGRALTAGDEQIPLIIDVVNNAENLCSIDALKKEMEEAACFLRQNGRAEEIVAESFEVKEQVEDCRKLFARLEASLSGTWEQYFQAAKAYSRAHDDSLAEMPRRYVSPEGLSVGNWIQTQKLVREGRQAGSLTDTQIHMLDSIGMVWENRLDAQFEKNFTYAESYFAAHGDLLVPTVYQIGDGFPLGTWLGNLRQRYAKGDRTGELDPARIERLNAIGMIWNVREFSWEKKFAEARAYYQIHGSIAKVPQSYHTETGFALGAWLQNVRRSYQGKGKSRALTEEQIHRLDAIGMRWDNLHGKKTEKEARSEAPVDPWDRNFEILKDYQKQYGTLDLSQDVIHQGVWIGKWLTLQKKAYEEGTLGAGQIQKLESIGYDWMNRSERQWQERYEEAADFYRRHGHLRVSRDQSSLKRWLNKQNVRHANGQLKPTQVKLLEQSGMNWR